MGPLSDAARIWSMAQQASVHAGLMPKVTVLYVPDYVATSTRLAKSAHLWRIIVTMLPEHEIRVPIAPGPFEDDHGISAFFGKGKGAMTPAKLVQDLKRDLLTSMATVLRAVKLHRPQIVVADGQGALIALALSRPLLLESCMALRNIQLSEVPSLSNCLLYTSPSPRDRG